jgi:hypothetical protein
MKPLPSMRARMRAREWGEACVRAGGGQEEGVRIALRIYAFRAVRSGWVSSSER